MNKEELKVLVMLEKDKKRLQRKKLKYNNKIERINIKLHSINETLDVVKLRSNDKR